ncbi:MAG: T9SS type A sorting domain-containing protein [Bacteroidales bacterium]|nr:T9SS type A sorting domain-containing protein [Bacteroidales bacterium]
MKRSIIALVLIIFTFTITSRAQGWRDKEMEVRVEIKDAGTAQILTKLNLNGDYAADHAILYVIPKEAGLLDKSGIEYTIQIPDLIAHYKDFWDTKVAYHSYQEIVDLADSLVDAFPDICMKKMYGTSIEGRELAALKISDNVGDNENEAEIFFDGGIHGDEIGAAENCIRFARDLCREYGSDPDITFLVDNREIWIYYMVNPDGRENMSRYNAAGVDLNRDYGYMWDAWGGSTGAFSQVEIKSLRNCSYENQFVVHTTYHSGTEYISCPWSYRPETPADAQHILQLAGIYSDVSGYANLEFGQGNSGMYAINGSTKDGNYGAAGSISWSMEISHDKQPPASQIMQYYNWNYPSMLAMIEYAGYGLEGTITDAATGDPVRGTIFINDYMQTYSDSTAGDYHKYVLPGKYSIKVMANGYETQVSADSVEVTEFNSTITDFQMVEVDSSRWYAWRMISSQIPGNNTVDEGNTLAMIGPPDAINYSIGKDGWIVVDMQKPIVELPGNDIKIFEGGLSPEGFTCYAGENMDGPWIYLGEGTGTTEFELSVTGLSEAQYFKIVDDGSGAQNEQDAGFDLDAISDLEHVVGVFIVMSDYTLDDENGNGHLDQGESADLIISLNNNGNITANNVNATLSTTSPYINITQSTANYGTLVQNQSGDGTFSFDVDESTPTGDTVTFTIDVVANGGIYSTSFSLQFLVGKFPILIIDLDGNHNSGTVMQDVISNIDVTATYETSFPDNLEMYQCIFVCLGIYDDNHVLTSGEGQQLADFLNNGGRVYMEGGDTWKYDPATPVHGMFKIQGLEDGNGDLGILFGQDGSFAEGMVYPYEGDNSYIDRIAVVDNAFELFRNQVPSYCNAVALDEGTYKTVGVSFEFGGLTDNQNTKEELMILILEFFGGVLTDVEENPLLEKEIAFFSWPNPFSNLISFTLTLQTASSVTVEIYNLNGQKIKSINDKYLSEGIHQFEWDGKSEAGNNIPAGMYIYKVQTHDQQLTGKIILNR